MRVRPQLHAGLRRLRDHIWPIAQAAAAAALAWWVTYDLLNHPAPFPVKLPEFIIRSFTEESDIVYEPFSGSGSTLIAGERTGRVVRAIELAPEYVDVTLCRWQQIFPNTPPILAATGKTFEQVAVDRKMEATRA